MDAQVIQNLVVGVVLPFLANFFDSHLPSKPFVKYVLILVVCGISGTVTSLVNGGFDVANIFGSLATIATTSQLTYMAFVKK